MKKKTKTVFCEIQMVQLQFYVMTSMLPSILAANALCKDKILKQFVSTKRNHCTYAEQNWNTQEKQTTAQHIPR